MGAIIVKKVTMYKEHVEKFLYRDKWSEAEVVFLTVSILSLHYRVRQEVTVNHGPRKTVGKGCRLDIVCYDTKSGEPLFSVEVKSTSGRTNTKKAFYESITGIPCYTVSGKEDAENVLSIVGSI